MPHRRTLVVLHLGKRFNDFFNHLLASFVVKKMYPSECIPNTSEHLKKISNVVEYSCVLTTYKQIS